MGMVARSALARDLATPCARLPTARLDELLEPLEIALDAAVGDAEDITQLLLQALGHEVHLHGDAGRAIVDLVERHDAGVVLAVGVAPSHTLLRVLLDDLRVPLMVLAAELGDPVKPAIVELPYLLDSLHEPGKVLELRPLVVGGCDWHVDFDRLLDRRGHLRSSARVPRRYPRHMAETRLKRGRRAWAPSVNASGVCSAAAADLVASARERDGGTLRSGPSPIVSSSPSGAGRGLGRCSAPGQTAFAWCG